MASRGRGRGRGAKRTFNKDQLNALGAGGNEPLSQLSDPPLLYTPLHRSAAILESSQHSDYELVLRQAFVNFMQLSYSYMKMPEQSDGVQEKLELPAKMVHDWRMFPSELRPKLKAKRKVKIIKKEENIMDRLDGLEKLENKSTYDIDKVKTEPNAEEDEDEEQEEDEEQMDDEIDDGTDYGNNYFDTGEGYYNDEDDNLDDGPVY